MTPQEFFDRIGILDAEHKAALCEYEVAAQRRSDAWELARATGAALSEAFDEMCAAAGTSPQWGS